MLKCIQFGMVLMKLNYLQGAPQGAHDFPIAVWDNNLCELLLVRWSAIMTMNVNKIIVK